MDGEQRSQQPRVHVQSLGWPAPEQRPQENSATNRKENVGLGGIRFGRVGTKHIQGGIKAALEVRPLGEPEVFFIVVVAWFRAKGVEGGRCGAGKDEDAFADGMGNLALLEIAVLHGSQKVLQPLVVSGIEFIPEHHRHEALHHPVTHLMERSDEIR